MARGRQQGRGRRHRHQLDAAAGRRRGRRAGREVERQQPGDPAGPRRRPLRPALRRGDRGGLRGDRRLRRDLPGGGRRARSSRSRPAPSATPPTARAFIAELRERFALSARVLDGEEEARLTYLGATARAAADGADPGDRHRRRLDRADRRHRRARSTSTPRCRRASSATPSATSPPTRRPRSSWRRWPATCAGLIEAAAPSWPAPRPSAGIAVAGTPTSLAAIEMGLEPYDPERVHGHALTLPSIQRLLSRFASAPLAERQRDPRPAPRPGADDRRRRA